MYIQNVSPTSAEHVFFLSVHENFSRTEHILGHKASLSKFKIIEIILFIFFCTQCIGAGNQQYRKYAIIWRLNNKLIIYSGA